MTRRPPLSLGAWLRLGAVRRFLAGHRPVERVLEIGAGGGAMAVRLAKRFDYTGVEPDQESHRLASARLAALGRGRVVRGHLDDLDDDRPFDVVCAFEVLEHVDDDVAALREWGGRLGRGGGIVLSVPANRDRFGAWDERVGHLRRYDRGDLERVLVAAGFTGARIVATGFPVGYLTEAVRNAVARRDADRPASVAERTAESARLLQPGERTGWATALAAAPFRAVQRPFAATSLGTGFVAGARWP